MSLYLSNSKKTRETRTPYITPEARDTLKGKNKESTRSPSCSTQDIHDEDSCSSNSEIDSDKRRNIGRDHVNGKSKLIDSSRKIMAAVESTATLREASERQRSVYPANKGRDRERDEGTAKVASGCSSFGQHSDGAFEHCTTADATRRSPPPATQHRKDALDSQPSNRKPRHAWSLYEPPGRRVATPSSTDSKKHLSANPTAALPSTAKFSREHTKESFVAPEESLRGPAPPNAITGPPSCRNVVSAQKLSAAMESEVLLKRDGEEVGVDTTLSTGTGTLPATNPSSNPDTASGMMIFPNDSQQRETLHGGGAGLGVGQTPLVFPTRRSSSPELAQECKTVGDSRKSGGGSEKWARERGVENGSVISEALATLTTSSEDVSDRTRESKVEEERSPMHHAGEASPMHVHEVKNVAPMIKGGVTPDVGPRGDISPFTELDTGRSVESKANARVDGTNNNEASHNSMDFGDHVHGKNNLICCSPESTTTVGASRATPSIPGASERQPSGNPEKNGRVRGQDGSTSPGSPQSNRRPRQGWAVYKPPGRRVPSSSPPESRVKSSSRLLRIGKLKDDSVALENNLREPDPTNAITEPPDCREAGGSEGDGIDTSLSTGTSVVKSLPSSHLDTGSDVTNHPNKSRQKEVPEGRGAAFGVKHSPSVSSTGRSSSPEEACQKPQEDWTADDSEKSGGGSVKWARERGVENGGVISEALATLTSSEDVSDRTRAAKVEEERATLQSHHAGEASPMHVHEVEKNVAPMLKGGVTPDVEPRGDISLFAERGISGSVEAKGNARVNGKGSDSGAKVEGDVGGSQEKSISKAPMERYIPPNRRRMLDAATSDASSASEWMGPLWTSRAPIRVRQKERPSDGQTSESSTGRSAPAKISGVVRGGMSAYGANISEYSEQMSREQVEECTALITNFPSALPPGQREPMLEPFHSFGALITWPRPDEALATFSTPALARQAVSARANRSTVLVVKLLSDVPIEKRKLYQKIELARPGRPPTDVSGASRLITGSLGIRRPRERPNGKLNPKPNRNASGSGVRGHRARKTQATESTDSWDM